jgi:hypothetical protein
MVHARQLSQEDFCPATGTTPGLKYESDGDPGIRVIMELLLGSENSAKDRQDFMLTQPRLLNVGRHRWPGLDCIKLSAKTKQALPKAFTALKPFQRWATRSAILLK